MRAPTDAGVLILADFEGPIAVVACRHLRCRGRHHLLDMRRLTEPKYKPDRVANDLTG